MIRAWRQQPGTLLITVVVLEVLAFAVAYGLGPTGVQLNMWTVLVPAIVGLVLYANVAWRIWRGGRTAWAFLLVLSGIPALLLLVSLFMAGEAWLAYRLGEGIIGAVQAALLLSPAIRSRIRARDETQQELMSMPAAACPVCRSAGAHSGPSLTGNVSPDLP